MYNQYNNDMKEGYKKQTKAHRKEITNVTRYVIYIFMFILQSLIM